MHDNLSVSTGLPTPGFISAELVAEWVGMRINYIQSFSGHLFGFFPSVKGALSLSLNNF